MGKMHYDSSLARIAMKHAMGWMLPALLSAMLAGAAEPTESVDLITSQAADGELAGWKSFSEDPAAKTGNVWKLADDGALICAGTPKGYIYTDKDYTDFVLRLEWRWPEDKPGRGGILLRTTGDNKIWPKSLEAQINAPDAGDFWGLDGFPLDGPPDHKKTLESPQFGTLTNLKKTADVEKAPGEWNTYEITARGDTVTLVINGRKVNEATGCAVAPGAICLTSEGSEIHFRNVQLRPLDKPAR
jgi:hypothetical protein